MARDLSYAWSHRFGWTMYSLFGFAILIGTLLRVYRKLATHLAIKYRDTAQQAAYDPAKSLSLVGKAHAFYMRHIFVPGAFGYHRATAWRWFSIPTRLQALWVLLYVAINVVFLASHYMIFPEYLSWVLPLRRGAHVQKLTVTDNRTILSAYTSASSPTERPFLPSIICPSYGVSAAETTCSSGYQDGRSVSLASSLQLSRR